MNTENLMEPAEELRKRALLNDLLITCIEGGSNHWVEWIDFSRSRKPETPGFNHYETFFDIDENEAEVIETGEDSMNGEGEHHQLTPERGIAGLALLEEEYPERYQAVIDEEYDADDADIWLQLTLLGDVVYG